MLQHRQGPPPRTRRKRGTQGQAIGRSRGGWTTKIVALTDALGNLVGFELLPGHRFDTLGVAPLIAGVSFGGLIADKAFDADWILAELDARGAEVVISQHPRRIQPLDLQAEAGGEIARLDRLVQRRMHFVYAGGIARRGLAARRYLNEQGNGFPGGEG